jgi:hypothetical protein
VWPATVRGEQRTTMAWSFAPTYDHIARKYYAVVETGCGPTWNEGFYLAAVASDRADGGWTFVRWLSPYFVNSPHLLQAPNGSFVLHFQTGRVEWPHANASAAPTCSGGPGNGPALPPAGTDMPLRACGAQETEAADNCLCSTLSAEVCAANIHVARNDGAFDAANGWSVVQPVTVAGAGWNPFNSTVPNIGESNPAAALLSDGRALLAFRSHLKGGYWPGVRGEHIGFAMGGSGAVVSPVGGLLQTAYNVTANLSYTTAVGNDEDPFLWQQPDGTLHCLYHNGRSHTRNLGLHAFSRNGTVWHKPADARTESCSSGRHCTALYTNELRIEGGGTVTLTGRERPSLLFDAVTKRPTYLFNGAIPENGSHPWYAMAQAIGRGNAPIYV